MNLFWARTNSGSPIEFIGNSWEDGGFTVNSDGEPVSDASGNAVAVFTWRGVKPCDAAPIVRFFTGGSSKPMCVWGLIDFMCTSLGFCDHQASEVLSRLRLTITTRDLEELNNLREARLKDGMGEKLAALVGDKPKRGKR